MRSKNLLSYSNMLDRLGSGTKHILLGNGYSIACDTRFNYPNLFTYACNHGLSERAKGLFDRLGTNNFEGVMRMLEDTIWTAKKYEMKDAKALARMKKDLDSIKNALVEAIAETHLEHSGKVPDEKKDCCITFLNDYFNVFTTNYDLLLYWVAMHAPSNIRQQDGFRAPIDFYEEEPDSDPEYLVFREHAGRNRAILFLHGALHIFVVSGEVRKHSWRGTGTRLVDLVRKGLMAGQYPLFVAEGKPEKKRQQIQHSGYLSYCLGKLERIESPLVFLGHSLNESDQHILDTVSDNEKVKSVAVGLFDDPDSSKGMAVVDAAKRMQTRRRKWKGFPELDVLFFDSKTAPVWSS